MASSLLSSIMNNPWTGAVQRSRGLSRGGHHDQVVDDQVYCASPPSIEEAAEAGDRLIEGQKVIVNLTGVQFDMQQRIIDFLTGVAFGLGGEGKRIADGVFMFVPEGVAVEVGGMGSAPYAHQMPPQQQVRPRVIG
jgi:FtsZ-interacting cell division protein YlmF